MKEKVSWNFRPGLVVASTALFVAGLFVLLSAPAATAGFAGTTDAVSICPPQAPPVCMTECLRDKRECWKGGGGRKRRCLEGGRAGHWAGKAGCRTADNASEAPGVCRRRCIAAAIVKAKKQCKLGFPVCYRECNPQSCREECGIDRPAVTPNDATVCRPPVDRPCLGQCARDLKQCARRVYRDGKQCVSGCRELTGADRRMCVRDCVDKTVAAGKQCVLTFRECVAGCKPTIDPTTPAPIG